MKSFSQRKTATAAVAASWISAVAVLGKAIHYCRAARRDELAGFPHTAAMEWRHAAELFESNTLAAEYLWRQWERIMHLPRQLSGPIGDSRTVVLTLERSATQPTYQISPAIAA